MRVGGWVGVCACLRAVCECACVWVGGWVGVGAYVRVGPDACTMCEYATLPPNGRPKSNPGNRYILIGHTVTLTGTTLRKQNI